MLRLAFYSLLIAFALSLAAIGAVLWWILPSLPRTEQLHDVQLQTPLKVYTADASLIGEFGEKWRTPVAITKVPLALKQAFLAAEDDRFYAHPGVDWMAIVRAAFNLARSHEKRQGGSTITMQVARNFFLTPEKTFTRKLREIVLAMKIERELTKDQILELYLNKIFLGQRAYGVAAAAQVYFGAQLQDLSLAEYALIAGLPKAPSRLNPVSFPVAAIARRGYVLRRMLELGFIDHTSYDSANGAPLAVKLHGQAVETEASHLAEMVRAYMREKYGDSAYTHGYRVFTTATSDAQFAAVNALRNALVTYDRRHGYRGAEAHVELGQQTTPELVEMLNPYQPVRDLIPALVIGVKEREIDVLDRAGTTRHIAWEGLSWARRYKAPDQVDAPPRTAAEIVSLGDIVRLEWFIPQPTEAPKTSGSAPNKLDQGYWRLAQLPGAEGALVSLDSHDGAILALVGGFNFERSKFNRVTQALRQPGSNFKPFIYSAALDNGFTPASFINDAPIVFDTPGLEGAWRPENYSGTYYGPTRLRDALANSRNLVSIRLMREMGVNAVLKHVGRFGFDVRKLPHNLSLSLGTGELTPLQLVAGYAAFSNGGFRVEPYFVRRIESANGEVLYTAQPKLACSTCEVAAADEEPEDLQALIAKQQQTPAHVAERAIDAQNAWIMYSMLKDVITRGTGRRALELKRADLAGKTGTTNDLKDAWFSGFNGQIVATTWVGFDDSTPLGTQETGATASLPMWMDYMRAVLKDAPLAEAQRPAGLVTVRIDPNSGLVAGSGNSRAIYETFRAQDVPRSVESADTHFDSSPTKANAAEHLF